MTTVDVRKVHCDRCKRVEERPIVPFDPMRAVGPGIGLETPEIKTWAGTTPTPAFSASIIDDAAGGSIPPRKVEFGDLCGPCKRTIAALLDQIGKKIDGLSPERKERGAKKKEEAAQHGHASSKTSPHSAAAASSSGKGSSTGMRSS